MCDAPKLLMSNTTSIRPLSISSKQLSFSNKLNILLLGSDKRQPVSGNMFKKNKPFINLGEILGFIKSKNRILSLRLKVFGQDFVERLRVLASRALFRCLLPLIDIAAVSAMPFYRRLFLKYPLVNYVINQLSVS